MDLSEITHPALTPARVKTLAQFQIETLADLLSNPAESIARILNISYTQAVELVDMLFRDFAPFPVMCVELYQNQVKTECVIKTGSALDSLLAGGFKTGSVYEVYGLPGVGKSQLCMTIAVSCSLEHGKQSVLYIDTKNDLSAERMLEILQARTGSPTNLSLLSSIHVGKLFCTDTIINTLSNVVSSFPTDMKELKLIILDNLFSPVRHLVDDEITAAFSAATQITQLLLQICRKGVCIVTVNSSRLQDEESLPSLGKLWASLPDVRLNMDFVTSDSHQNFPQDQKRKITVVKGSLDKPICDFIIDSSGVS
ncbi:DNA repair protein RAD51 homolog 4 [Eurytemora carolleeae]|uniref:DNA repair protein RAD51 homolog 4 n=1 Tax=Eurytemora carolleeae TaxID=1294199 RepID=UPI000C77F4A2|nr:DNA repair protein RAD51 homolog 4 [Eurytemora carolleeae]|eukprot:XP_023341520.1 DNA repair protein RAD51 homolog 4-like [Eurytemora affinis]